MIVTPFERQADWRLLSWLANPHGWKMDFSRSLLVRLVAATPLAALGCEGSAPTPATQPAASVSVVEPLPLASPGIARSLYAEELELRAQPVAQHQVVSADEESDITPARLPEPDLEVELAPEALELDGPTIAPPEIPSAPPEMALSHPSAGGLAPDPSIAPSPEWNTQMPEMERLPPTDELVPNQPELWLSVPEGPRLPEVAENTQSEFAPSQAPPLSPPALVAEPQLNSPEQQLPSQPVQSSPPQQHGQEQSRHMYAVSEQAAVHVRRGFTLAGRGAHYSARSEFIQALRLVSGALDAQSGTEIHGQALAAGLRALEESDDFVPGGSLLEANMDVAALIPAHRTPVLKDLPAESLTVLDARRQYYTYAQEQLSLAVGHERSGSMALYGMGRVQSSLAERNVNRHASATPKAIALHQASLQVDMDNFMAANELGVLLARFGQYESARDMLVHSVRLEPQAASWHNLAVVQEKLGQHALASQARQHSAVLAQRPANSGETGIIWTDTKTFSRNVTLPAEASPPVTREASTPRSGPRK